MKGDNLATMVGTVIADETFIGGKITNKHRSQIKTERVVPGERNANPHMTTVLSLIDKGTGEVRSTSSPT